MTDSYVVIGFGITGQAVARHLLTRGESVVVVDDNPSPGHAENAAALGADFIARPDEQTLAAIIGRATTVIPSPGVPPGHPAYAAARTQGIPLISEVELGARIAADRRTPVIAVTGTNGKTTVTTLITAMLDAAGHRARAAGNIGTTLIEAVGDETDVLVVEVSSFQLQYTKDFRPDVAVWLNLSEDHLDWHPSSDDYAAAKALIWRNQRADDVAVVNADDPVVMAHAEKAPSRIVTFGSRGDYRVDGKDLVGPGGPLLAVADLPRALPHDIANALAAIAAAQAFGAPVPAIVDGLTSFEGLPHRVERIGESGGVVFYDDSKATTPASVLAALAGFDSVVLIAGGRNKGLDLTVLRAAAPRLRAVVAIGDAAGDIEDVFAGTVDVTRAESMDDAVRTAAELARPGDAVLLSPGCASYDWYRSYAERGDDFARAAREKAGVG